ncbi:MAG: glycosyltransferase family 1 protein, partial [Gammaproteobacteria bacterium]|nr:glycosyltransferase family 1 protein [Gammaproteobacteria bacterium]
MKLAFCIFRVFPYGGLSRDFMKIATACANRGHDVRAYAHRWDTTAPEGSIDMVAVPTKGATHAT